MKRLTKLANKYNTDKGSTWYSCHEYTEIYEEYFNRYENPVILEIGTGEGGSARMFNAFYDGNCEIYTLDINKKFENFFEEKNIHFIYADTNSEESVIEVYEKIKDKKFDIIIDDGSHFSEDQCRCMKTFYKLLKKDGIYIIEDLFTNVCLYGDSFEKTLLYFLCTGNYIPFFTQEEYAELKNKIKSFILYSRKNDTIAYGCVVGKSMTGILTFEYEN